MYATCNTRRVDQKKNSTFYLIETKKIDLCLKQKEDSSCSQHKRNRSERAPSVRGERRSSTISDAIRSLSELIRIMLPQTSVIVTFSAGKTLLLHKYQVSANAIKKCFIACLTVREQRFRFF